MPLLLQKRLKLVAAVDADRVLVEDRLVGRIDERRRDAGEVREAPVVVVRGVGAPLGAPRREMRQLGAQHRRLQRVEPAVEADFVVKVLLRAAVHAQALEPRRRAPRPA